MRLEILVLPGITDEWVEAEIRRLLDGGEAKGGPSRFLVGCLKDEID